MDPIGTKEAVVKAGFDPKFVGSCSPGGMRGENRGCSHYEACPFRFKDRGPKMVAARVIKPSGRIKEMGLPCFRWMQQFHEAVEKGIANAEVFGNELTKKPTLIAITGSEPANPADPRDKKRRKFAKEVPLEKFPSIEEAFPEEVQSQMIQNKIRAQRMGRKIYDESDEEEG